MYQQKLKLIFKEIKSEKKEIRKIRAMYKDALSHSENYKKLLDEIEILKNKKKKIENKIKEEMQEEFNRVDDLKRSINMRELLMSDMVVKMISDGEDLAIKDESDKVYTPQIKVKYKIK